MKSADKTIRVGILCFSQKRNYGAKIVAWALQEKVKSLLPDNEEVGLICNENHQETKTFDGMRNAKSLSDLWQSGRRFVNEQLKKRRAGQFNNHLDTAAKQLRNERFAAFDKQYLHFLGRSDSAEEFKAIASELDAVIVGSDIVFRPEYVRYFPDVYMLHCLKDAPNAPKKLSYAAAIATDSSEILEPLKEAYAEGMKNYDAISVRERFAQQFLQELTYKPVYHCCDPVLLFSAEDFDFVPSAAAEGKAIYANLLDHSKNSSQYLKKLSAEKGLKVQFFSNADVPKGDAVESVYSDGPLEFIDRIRSAKYVVTNSFHTVLFSILFHKPFVVLAREGQDLKLLDVLATFGLEDRIVNSDTVCEIDNPIDWDEVDKKVQKLREESLAYLKMALEW